MNTASTKIKALVAGGAAIGAFGIGTLLPATADAPSPGPGGESARRGTRRTRRGRAPGTTTRASPVTGTPAWVMATLPSTPAAGGGRR